MKRSKYGNVATFVDGIRFDSKREAKRYGELKMLQFAGEIAELELQPGFVLNGAKGPIKTPTGRLAKYVADFRYFDIRKQLWVIEDSKGAKTDVYLLKKAILLADGIEIFES